MTTNHVLSLLYQNKNMLIVQTHTGQDTCNQFGFNMGLHVFDESQTVLANRAKLLSLLATISGGVITQLRWANQVHGNAVALCDDVCCGALAKAPIADALITSQVGVGLSMMTADCVPIAIFEENGGAIACIHAGTKGLVCGVIGQTVLAMKAFDSPKNPDSSKDAQLTHKPSATFAYVGACISQAHYQMPLSMAMDVLASCHNQGLIDASDSEGLMIECQDNKALLDIAGLAKAQLQKLGLIVISDAPDCTYQNAQYYSHRQATHQQRMSTGRMALVIAKLT